MGAVFYNTKGGQWSNTKWRQWPDMLPFCVAHPPPFVLTTGGVRQVPFGQYKRGASGQICSPFVLLTLPFSVAHSPPFVWLTCPLLYCPRFAPFVLTTRQGDRCCFLQHKRGPVVKYKRGPVVRYA